MHGIITFGDIIVTILVSAAAGTIFGIYLCHKLNKKA